MHVEFFVKLVYPTMTEEHQIGNVQILLVKKLKINIFSFVSPSIALPKTLIIPLRQREIAYYPSRSCVFFLKSLFPPVEKGRQRNYESFVK